MVNWFGPASWGAPICSDAPRCEIPVGTFCCRCEVAITETDEGVTMPGGAGPVTFHLACHLKSILPHSMWPSHGLIPTTADGLRDGRFVCRSCGVAYAEGIGWWTR